MLNHIVIMGRTVRDPELRKTGSGISVSSFTVAVDRDFSNKNGGEKETDYIDCVAWRQTGDFVAKYFPKGKLIVVSGRLQIRSWTDKDGNKRKTAEVVADNVYFGGDKRDSNGINTSGAIIGGQYPETNAALQQYGYGQATITDDYVMLTDDDNQLPF